MYIHVPTGFVPQEDQNYFIVVVQAPPGASLSYTTEISQQAEKILLADPDVFGTFAVPGFSLSGGSSSNYGLVFAPLKPISEREGKGHSAARNRGARLAQSFLAFRERSWWPSSRRPFRASAASADSSSSFRTWAATRCRTSTRLRTRSSLPAVSARI